MTWQLAVGFSFLWVMVVDIIDHFHIPVPSDWIVLEPIRKWAVDGHKSDCSLFNGPAYRPWPCSCDRPQGWLKNRIALYLQQRAYDEGRT